MKRLNMRSLAVCVLGGIAPANTYADTTLTSIPLPGGTSAVGAFTLASAYGQASTLDALAASTVMLEPGFLCVEAADIPIPGDFNHDGHVNGIDVAVVLGNWGICSAGVCVGDITRDGQINGADLAILLSNWR